MTVDTSQAESWSTVAGAWDAGAETADGPMSDATEQMIAFLDVQPGDRVLELAAGPGSLGATWSRLVGPAGRVLLSDIAPGMVEVARRRTEGLDNVEHAVIDASAIDRPDDSFDVVACRMGLMFAPDPAAAFAEVRRVLSPGGRFAALTWGTLEHNPWMTCVGMAAMANGIVAGTPPTEPGGIFSLGDPAVLEGHTTAAGFSGVTVESVDVVFAAASIDEHLARVTSLAGPLAVALAAAAPERYEAFHRTATELATPYLAADGLRIPGQALLVTGRA